MLRATNLIRRAAVKDDRVADTAWLDHAARGSRHAALRSHGGIEFLLDLDRTSVLSDGDAVKLEDGRLIRVRAAPQALLEIRAENPLRLMRFAWHMGQRHTPAEFKGDALYIEPNAGLAEMARNQGCAVTPITRPFQPEAADQHVCEHHGHHGHDHDGNDHRGHARDHGHAHGHDHAGHEHGPTCGHDHGHKHEH